MAGLGGSKAAKVGLGFLTGGPVGAGMALLPDSGAGGALKMGASIAGGGGGAAAGGAMQRRMSAMQTDPNAALSQGLAALKDPSVPDEIRKTYAEPMLMAKHYGKPRGMA